MTFTHWLTETRVRRISLFMLVLGILWIGLNALIGWHRHRQPLGYDFLTFWSASWLALHHDGLGAYSWSALTQAAYLEVPFASKPGQWVYPPAFLLLMAPLAYVPFLLALPLFLAITVGLYLLALRALLPYPNVILAGIAFPGAWLNIILGQNGYLSAALVSFGLLWLKSRPILAGVCFGLLAAKPQLAVLLPLLLVITRQWRAICAAALTTVVTNGMALVLWGTGLISSFLHTLPDARMYIEQVEISLIRMCSVASTARLLGASLPTMYSLHVAAAALAIAAAIYIWRTTQDEDLRACAYLAATFLISPYIYIYDAVWYALYIGFFIRYAMRHGWLPGERELLLVLWLYPPLGALLAAVWHVGLGPLVSFCMLCLAVRRAVIDNRLWPYLPVSASLPPVTPLHSPLE